MMMNGKDKRNRAGTIFLLCVLCSAFSSGSFAEQNFSEQGSSNQGFSKENSELQKNLSSGSIYDESTAVMLNPSEGSENKIDSVNESSSDITNKETGTVSERKIINERKAVDQPALKTDSGRHLVSVFVGLAVIVALILALAWIVRRFSQGGIFTQSSIKVVAALPMGTRERLVVVDIAGQQILLGVTATQINKLHVFDEPVIDSSQPTAHSEFGRKLFAVMQQKTTNNTSTPKE